MFSLISTELSVALRSFVISVARQRPPVVAKVMDHIDDVSRAIIEKSPFIVLASATADGYPDVSPKGDPVGFVRVINEKLLAILDRPGNNRKDTFTNVLQNPFLAVIFFIPGKGETLRVTGECRIVRDQTLRERMAVNGCVPEFDRDPRRTRPDPLSKVRRAGEIVAAR